MDERDAFELLVMNYGIGRRGADKILADEMTYDGDCWSGAWREARRRGARYVEGSCIIGRTRVRAHAWVEEDTAFGVRIIECTKGYEEAHTYLGITVDCADGSTPEQMTGHWPEGYRASVIEALIITGAPVETILRTIGAAA